MWSNLTDETRKKIEAIGEGRVGSLSSLNPGTPYHDLFVQYYMDNVTEAQDQRVWECYWWMRSQSDSGYIYTGGASPDTLNGGRVMASGSRGASETLKKFEDSFGPHGITPIDWPSEIVDWFRTREQLELEADEARDAWDPSKEEDEYEPKSPEYAAWSDAVDRSREWSVGNPPPMEAVRKHCKGVVEGHFKAFDDEVSRMQGAAMTRFELDEDYIASLNEVNLKDLAEGAEVKCLGYGTYVLIGQFPPGYEKAVMSYDKAWYGTLTMKQKGGAFSPGKVTVTGCQGQDQEWFKTAFRRVSKKAISFE